MMGLWAPNTLSKGNCERRWLQSELFGQRSLAQTVWIDICKKMVYGYVHAQPKPPIAI
jgi:hypothetical protein